MKSVQIRSFFWSVFSCIWAEYGDLQVWHASLSDKINITRTIKQLNLDPKWNRITPYICKMVDIKLPFPPEKQTTILFGNYPDHVDFLKTTNTSKKNSEWVKVFDKCQNCIKRISQKVFWNVKQSLKKLFCWSS